VWLAGLALSLAGLAAGAARAAPGRVEIDLMCPITAVKVDAGGLTLTVARGAVHGVVAGSGGQVFARRAAGCGLDATVAGGAVTEVAEETATVRVPADPRADLSRVVVGAHFELRALVPDTTLRGLLLALAAFAVNLTDEAGAPVLDLRALMHDRTGEVEARALARMVAAGRASADAARHHPEEQPHGRWKGRRVQEILAEAGPPDYLAMARYVLGAPGHLVGCSGPAHGLFTNWLRALSPPALEDHLQLLLEAPAGAERRHVVREVPEERFIAILADERRAIARLPFERRAEALARAQALAGLLTQRDPLSASPHARAEVRHALARALHGAPKATGRAVAAYREASALYLLVDSDEPRIEAVICLNNAAGVLADAGRDDEAVIEARASRALNGRMEPAMRDPYYATHLRAAEVYPATVEARILERRGQHAEAVAVLEPLIARISEAGAPGGRAREIEVATLVARNAARAGALEKATALFERVERRAEELGDPGQQVTTALEVGDMLYDRARYGEALARFERALALARQAGLTSDAARAEASAGQTLWEMGRLDEALARHAAALAQRDPAREASAVAWQRTQIGRILIARGDYGRGEAELKAALETHRTLDERGPEAEVRVQLGRLRQRQRRPAEAEVEFAAAREVWRGLKRPVEEAEALRLISGVRLVLGDAEGAERHIREAVALLERTSDEQALVAAKLQRARNRNHFGDVAGARSILLPLLPKDRGADPGTAADVMLELVALDLESGALSEAEARWAEVRDLIGRTSDLARSVRLCGLESTLLTQRGDLDGALAALRRQVELARASGDAWQTAGATQNLAWALSETGRLGEALSTAQEAVRLAEAGEDQFQLAWAFNTLASVQGLLGDVAAQLAALDAAWQFVAALNDPMGQAAIAYNRALVHARLRDLPRALEGFEAVAKMPRTAINRDLRVAVPTARGMTLVLLGRHAEAEQSLATARELARTLLPGRLPAALLWSARAAVAARRHDAAIAFAKEAAELEARMSGGLYLAQATHGRVLAEGGRHAEARAALDAALGRAKAAGGSVDWELLFDRAKLAVRDGERAAAIALLEQAVATIERGEAVLPEDSVARGHADKVAVFRLLMRLLLAERRADEAFRYLERSKAAELRDLDRQTSAADDPGRALAIELDVQEQRLQRDLDASLAATPRDEARIANLEALLSGTRERRAALMERVDRDRAAFDGYALRPFALEKLQAALAEGVLVLSPVLLDDSAVVFAVTKDALTHFPVDATPDALRGLVKDFVRELDPKTASGARGRASLARAKELGARLHGLLVAPALATFGVPATLVISPTGALRYIPYAALHDGERWLIEATTLVHLTDLDREKLAAPPPRSEADLGLLALLDPDGTLPEARRELGGVTPSLSDSLTLMGPDATLANLSQRLRVPGYEVLHLATHGRLDPQNPALSSLVLADRPLTWSAINTLKPSKTRLVVLSACRTAVATGGDGLEIAGLAHKFLLTSVHTVLATLQEVDDHATAALMTAFYRGLREGRPYREALALAQRAQLATPGFEHPAHWAPFSLIGPP
jgi:CHAT domain-containing protein